MSISNAEYRAEVLALATSLAAEAMCEMDNDVKAAEELVNGDGGRLFQTIEDHPYCIYYAYHLSVLEHSDNAEHMQDNLGADALVDALKSGLSGLHGALAFWAMYADVQELLSDALDAVGRK